MPDRPLIGLSCYREQARWGVWDQEADLLPATYARSVEAAGAVAVLLPPQAQGAQRVVGALDALLITGGPDVDPSRYGATAHPNTDRPRSDRDAWEWILLDEAARRGLPTLGICRGMQLMAVHAGGTLEQHVPDVVGHSEHAPEGPAFGWTAITTRSGSKVRGMVGNHLQVSCHHHQSVTTSPGFEVTARAADGTVEAIEDPEHPFRIGVQWHPELGDDYLLFRGLVQAAAAV